MDSMRGKSTAHEPSEALQVDKFCEEQCDRAQWHRMKQCRCGRYHLETLSKSAQAQGERLAHFLQTDGQLRNVLGPHVSIVHILHVHALLLLVEFAFDQAGVDAVLDDEVLQTPHI